MTNPKAKKKRASRNRTVVVSAREKRSLAKRLINVRTPVKISEIKNRVVFGNTLSVLDFFPSQSFDLIFADPPYNLNKNFGSNQFRQKSLDEYEEWLDSWLSKCLRILKPDASIYICGDWRSASAIQRIGMKYFTLRNRITWEREKGRGSKTNWKNASEDIWFFTVSNRYYFDSESVKLKRRVLAPYKDAGKPKDWKKEKEGNFRKTAASNLWTDLTVPFWSMPENTNHPTQKPEKLLAKIILANTKKHDLILDPFSGSGTTAVVARKLERNFVAIESDKEFCLVTEKRLELAEKDKTIQGFSDGVFWHRNSVPKK